MNSRNQSLPHYGEATTDHVQRAYASRPTLAISQITTQPLSLAQELDLAVRLGYSLEVAENKLPTDPTAAADALKRIQDSGVSVVSLQPATLTPFPSAFSATPAEPRERIDALKASIERFAPLWPGRPLVTNTGAPIDSGNEAQVFETCVEAYRELAEHAEQHGMTLALEALAPSLMNRNSILYTFAQALEMAEAVDHPVFGVCLDLYNSWQDVTLPADIALAGDRLQLVQLADWRRPHSFHDRRALGDGQIALAPLLAALQQSGYRGPYVLEIFSSEVEDSLWQDVQTVERAVDTSLAHFARLTQHLAPSPAVRGADNA